MKERKEGVGREGGREGERGKNRVKERVVICES